MIEFAKRWGSRPGCRDAISSTEDEAESYMSDSQKDMFEIAYQKGYDNAKNIQADFEKRIKAELKEMIERRDKYVDQCMAHERTIKRQQERLDEGMEIVAEGIVLVEVLEKKLEKKEKENEDLKSALQEIAECIDLFYKDNIIRPELRTFADQIKMLHRIALSKISDEYKDDGDETA